MWGVKIMPVVIGATGTIMPVVIGATGTIMPVVIGATGTIMPVVIGATGTISESFRKCLEQHLESTTSRHCRKQSYGHCVRTAESSNVKVQNI